MLVAHAESTYRLSPGWGSDGDLARASNAVWLPPGPALASAPAWQPAPRAPPPTAPRPALGNAASEKPSADRVGAGGGGCPAPVS